jgi:predicted AAA+ superfamily ATPase
MKRFIEENLIKWKDEKARKPLILSGARQVGKSYVIEQNFAPHFKQLLTINFEKQPEFNSCFKSGYDTAIIMRRIEALAGQRLKVGSTLVFFDEIQFCPEAIISLRYFYEEMPDLHIIAAGSLLEFTIENISVPVGRVTFRHLGPMSFEEFLYNSGNQFLLDEIREHSINMPFPEALHNRAISLLKEYMAFGGMPQVVESYIEHQDYLRCQELLSDLLESYIKDFPKYSSKHSNLKYIDTVFSRIPHLVGNQFKFVQISRDVQSKYLRDGLDLLYKADLVKLIYKTSGIPLGANYNPQRFKLLFLDIGLMQRACDLKISRWITDSYNLINSGPVSEQFVGQEICANSNFKREKLYYWTRDKRGSSAEVDYMIEHGHGVIPVEVKAGASGKLKSMHLLLDGNPDISEGIKVSLDNFEKQNNIQSIPLYAFGSWLEKRDIAGRPRAPHPMS